MRVTVAADRALERAGRLLSEVPGGVEKALVSSLNRAAQMGKTQATREVTSRYTVKAKDVRPTMKLSRATKSSLEAEIESRGPALGLSHYRHSPRSDTTGSRRKPIRVAVKRDGGLKPLGKAFVWRGKIMERSQRTRLPINKMMGPSVPSVMNNPEIVDAVLQTSEENVVKRLDHEVNRILKV